MSRKIVVWALAAIASWAVVPTEADAFGHHRKRGRHHRASNACCAPQPVCSTAASQYQTMPVQHPVQHPGAQGSCCGSESYGMNMGSQGHMNQGGQYYEGGSGGYIQGDGQGLNNPQPQAYGHGNVEGQIGNVHTQGNHQGRLNTQGEGSIQGQNLRSQNPTNTATTNANVGANANVGSNGISGAAEGTNASEGIGVGKADMAPDGGR